MRFDHDGKTYALDFQRDYKLIRLGEINGEVLTAPSRYPYTTARVLEVDQALPVYEWPVYRTATVGCWHKEPVFRLERGRLHALRLLSRTLNREMKVKVWDTYMGRHDVEHA